MAKSYDFKDGGKSAYQYEAQKLNLSPKAIVVAGGNQQVFAAFHRRLLQEAGPEGGIEVMLKRGPTLLNRSSRAWETETRFKWPKLDIDVIREARHTYSVIAGYNDKRKRISIGAVADNPALNSLAPENGFIVQCINLETRHSLQTILKEMLFGPKKMLHSKDGMIEAAVEAVKAAAGIELSRTGEKIMGGKIRLAQIDGPNAPQLLPSLEGI